MPTPRPGRATPTRPKPKDSTPASKARRAVLDERGIRQASRVQRERLSSQASTQGYVPGNFPFAGRFVEDVRLDPSQVTDLRKKPITRLGHAVQANRNPVELYPTPDGVRARYRKTMLQPQQTKPAKRSPPPQPKLPPTPKRRRP